MIHAFWEDGRTESRENGVLTSYRYGKTRFYRYQNGRWKLRISSEEGANIRWWHPIIIVFGKPFEIYVVVGGKIGRTWHFFRFQSFRNNRLGFGHERR